MQLFRIARPSIALAVVMTMVAPAVAGGTFSLFGDATKAPGPTKKSPVAVQLDSDVDGDFQYSGIAFEPARTKRKYLRLSDIKTLAATYQILEGGFGGGSVRFSILLDEDRDGEADNSVFVYLGEYPSFDDEPGALTLTGNLVADETLRFDSTQIGGDFYGTWDEAVALAGNAEVVGVILVADGYWVTPDGLQSVLITSMQVNSDKLNPRTVKFRRNSR
jgi:hypothetical protein